MSQSLLHRLWLDCAIASMSMFFASVLLWISGGVLYLLDAITLADMLLPLTAALTVVFALGTVVALAMSWVEVFLSHRRAKGEKP